MGLDIYLFTKDQEEHNRLHNKEEEDFYGGEEWPLYDSKTDAEKDAFRANRKYPNYEMNTDVPSVKHGGDKLCNRRYLRSSYNGGGFDAAVPKMLDREAGFDWIFADVKDYGDYRIPLDQSAVPNLRKARERAKGVVKDLAALEAPLGVTTVTPSGFSTWPTTKQDDALKWAKEQLAKPEDGFFGGGGWSSREGDFFGKEGAQVLAAVPGVDILGIPGFHLIYRLNKEAADSYLVTAEIVVEFIDEALELIANEGFCALHWSG